MLFINKYSILNGREWIHQPFVAAKLMNYQDLTKLLTTITITNLELGNFPSFSSNLFAFLHPLQPLLLSLIELSRACCSSIIIIFVIPENESIFRDKQFRPHHIWYSTPAPSSKVTPTINHHLIWPWLNDTLASFPIASGSHLFSLSSQYIDITEV